MGPRSRSGIKIADNILMGLGKALPEYSQQVRSWCDSGVDYSLLSDIHNQMIIIKSKYRIKVIYEVNHILFVLLPAVSPNSPN
jgi:hypothetical protein